MKYVCNTDLTIIATHTDDQAVQNLYPNCTVYKSDKFYELGETFVIEPPTVKDLTEFLYQAKCNVAYGGVTVVKGDQNYVFETTQDSITMCNSIAISMDALPDTYTVLWKVWQNDIPTVLELTKQQFKNVFAFGMNMINEAFYVEGLLNNTVQAMSLAEREDLEYIEQFKTQAIEAFNAVATVYVLDAPSDSATVSDSTSIA